MADCTPNKQNEFLVSEELDKILDILNDTLVNLYVANRMIDCTDGPIAEHPKPECLYHYVGMLRDISVELRCVSASVKEKLR